METQSKLPHAFLVMAFAVQILWPGQVIGAANRMLESVSATAPMPIVLAQEVIAPAQPSPVLLKGAELAKAQEEWSKELHASKPAIAVEYMTLSAYNSMENQTDGSPYSTAIGSLTRDGVVASNNLPIGTRVRFPDHFGDKVFRVEDRMNTRYQNNVDVWMEDYKDAIKFGRRYAKVEVVEWGKGRGMD
jgi:3D (Asp-Asp-Asp) domain-containing protein